MKIDWEKFEHYRRTLPGHQDAFEFIARHVPRAKPGEELLNIVGLMVGVAVYCKMQGCDVENDEAHRREWLKIIWNVVEPEWAEGREAEAIGAYKAFFATKH